MPSDEYASASGGALRLKGAKVEKHRSKKHKKRSRDKDNDRDSRDKRAQRAEEEHERAAVGSGPVSGSEGEGEGEDRKTKKKKQKERQANGDDDHDDDDGNDPYARMTVAERRFAEAQDKKIRDLLHASPEEARAARPELFKSHKERLADLNTYLSRLSEHNDMPKIGPG